MKKTEEYNIDIGKKLRHEGVDTFSKKQEILINYVNNESSKCEEIPK